MGCPAGHFHEYKYLGTELSNYRLDYARIKFNNEIDLFVKTGYYYEFIDEKENGLGTIIKVNPDFNLNKNSIVKEVTSSLFGKLNKVDSLPYTARVNDTANTLMYKLTFERRNETKTLKKIKNDTISIQLVNGEKLHFARGSK